MHELAIADAVVRIACEQAAGSRVAVVELKVGHLRQVVPDALTFAFELVAAGTAAEGAELVIEDVPLAGRCRGCGAEEALGGLPLCCPACGALDVELTAGEELRVEALELEEALSIDGGRVHGD
jgi:hydrogenase nickel incorporation protein HypA/HybF